MELLMMIKCFDCVHRKDKPFEPCCDCVSGNKDGYEKEEEKEDKEW